MANRKIHIDKLRITLPRGTAGDAKAVARSIGRDVMKSVANVARGSTGSFRIDEISAGKIRSTNDVGLVGKQVASRIGSETEKQLKRRRR